MEKPVVKVASRNMFYDENGKHVRTKKEISDASGDIRNGCKIIRKGEGYEKKELSVKERIVKIRDILRVNKRVNFVELFDDFSKPYVVVTFLSVLEMVKSREINIKQDNNFSDIYIERVD